MAAGAVGGALAGYLGGGPFNLGQFGNQVLLVATLGGAIGLIGVLAIWIVVRDRDWMHWWLVPALAGSAALTLGIQQLIDWGLGWAAAQAGKGLIAAAIGSVIGGVLSAAGAYVLAWRRESRRSKSAARAPQGSIR